MKEQGYINRKNEHGCYDCFQCYLRASRNLGIVWENGETCKHLREIDTPFKKAPDECNYVCTQKIFNYLSRINIHSLA
jgi:hypothetical protein